MEPSCPVEDMIQSELYYNRIILHQLNKCRYFCSKSTGKHARDTCYKYDPKGNSWAQTSGTMKIDRTHGGSDYHPNWGLAYVGGLR